jgi:excisionase family DNA binding protein
MVRTRDIPEPTAPAPAPAKLLHAGEVARLAGLHKTTVLLAVRRGELKASRTVGRSVRIALPDAVAFLQSRGISLAVAKTSPSEPRVVVVLTEQAEVHRRFGELLGAAWRLSPRNGLYDDLITLGLRPPAAVVIDLDVLGLNPLAIVRVLRAHAVLGQVPLLALSQVDAPLAGAVAHGAEVALRAGDAAKWRAALAGLG